MASWLPPHIIGGSGGNNFQQFGNTAFRLVRTINVHSNSNNLTGISIFWLDGTSNGPIGTGRGRFRTITFDEGETVTQASLWASKSGTHTGRILLKTSTGQVLDNGGDVEGLEEFGIDVGSGYLGGIVGRHGDEVNSLGLRFMRPITSVEISNVQYNALPPNSNIIPNTITQTKHHNPGLDDVKWVFSNAVTRTNKTIWELPTFNRFGPGVQLRGAIPEITSSGGGKFEWRLTIRLNWAQTNSTPIWHPWKIESTLKPGQTILATSTIQAGSADVPFSSIVIIRLDDDSIMSYQDSGILKITQHRFPSGTYVDLADRKDFHSSEPFPNDDGKVPVVPEKDPARKDDDGKLVATTDLKVPVCDDGKLPAVPN